MIEDLEAILGFARGHTSDAFKQRYPAPALTLWIPESDTALDDDANALQTTMDDEAMDKILLSIQKRNRVGWLTKSDNNFFGNLISVGRAPTNDLQIPLETISKVHAMFTKVGNGWRVEHTGATNGLFVNGQQVLPGSKVDVKDGDTIRFGHDVDATFHTPEGLHLFLTNLVPPG